MKLKTIIDQQCAYVTNSGFTVKADSLFSTVAIKDEDGEGFFLQGHEADDYIDECLQQAEETDEDISVEDFYIANAAQYIDCL